MRLWDFLDGRLPDMAREEVELHLATCALCPPHFAFAGELRRALASSAPQRLGAGEEARLRERVLGALARLGEAEGE
jgi:anti-sigma factor RsiW